jgi:GNAT superfamily N-acetyltransferase
MKAGLRLRELDPSDTDLMLELRNSIFDPISRDHWEAMGCTAVVATLEGRLRGAIPLQFRDFRLNAHTHVPVVFENAVGVDQAYRSQGVGTAMLDCAADFIRDRAYALCVYRGGERTSGYRFYRKTGHGDLYYTSFLTLSSKAVRSSWSTLCEGVEILPWQAAANLEEELLRIFEKEYGSCGGYWKRDREFFQRAVTSHVFREGVARLFLVRPHGKISGYSISNAGDMNGYLIYDMAAPDPQVFRRLVAAMAIDAKKQGQDLKALSNQEHPVFDRYLDCGFEPERSEPYIMARVVRPACIFGALARESDLESDLLLKAVTPHRDVVLNAPKRARLATTLYLKEHQLSRLLFCRLDLQSALRTNLVRISPTPQSVADALCRIFEFCPWVTCRLDYI